MSNNQFTALHQTALSPLCHTPHANNISDPNSRALAAVDTLESAAAVLAAHSGAFFFEYHLMVYSIECPFHSAG